MIRLVHARLSRTILAFLVLLFGSGCHADGGYLSGGESSLPRAHDGNYVQNGGFEEVSNNGSDLPVSWIQNVAKTANKGQIQQLGDKVFSGQNAVRIEPSKKNGQNFPISLAQEIPATALRGKEIVFSGRISTEGGAKGLIGLMHVADGKASEFSIIFQGPTNGEWVYQEKSYRVPDTDDLKLYLSIWTPDTEGTVWFDDIFVGMVGATEHSANDGGRVDTAPSLPPPVESDRAPGDGDTLKATINVETRNVIRDIPATLFGANVEWRWNATSLWQERQQRVDPRGLKLADELGVTLIRYPGGIYSDYYHWRNGVGPYEERPMMKHEPGKKDQSRANFGTDEALRFADDIGAELMITVNIVTGTPEEAADWVRYVNRDGLRVRYWEIGNEQYINSSSPVSQAATMKPSVYAEKVQEFATAMRAADDRIQIGIIGGLNEGSYKQMDYRDWDKIVFGAVGEYADFISVHNAYAPILAGDEKNKDLRTVYSAMLGRPTAIARNLDRLSDEIDESFPNKESRPFVAVTEWGPIFQFFHSGAYVDHPKTLGSALFVAGTLKSFVESPVTDLAAFWMLNDYSVLGWMASANADFPPDPEWIPTARFYVFQMFSRYFGERLVESTSRSPTFSTEKVGWSDAEKNLPYLDVISSLDASGNELYLMAINYHFDAPVEAEIDIADFIPQPNGERWELSGSAIDAHTGSRVINVPGLKWGKQKVDEKEGKFGDHSGDSIWFEHSAVSKLASVFSYTFPPRSVTTLKFTRL